MEVDAQDANVSSQEDTGCCGEKKSGCETGRKSTPLCGEYLVLIATSVGPFPDTLLSASDDGGGSHNCEQVYQVTETLMCCQKVIDIVMATQCNYNVRSTQQSCLVRREVGGNDRIWERTGGVVSQSSTSKDQGFTGECS